MSIRFLCGHCKKVVNIKDEFAGKKGKCPHCGQVVSVPVPAKPLAAAKPAAPLPAKEKTTIGKVTKVDAEKKAVTVKDDAGRNQTFTIGAEAKISIDGKDAKFDAIVLGQTAAVTTKDEAVIKVEVKSPTAPPPGPMDAEAEAAALLADEPKPENAPPPATIDFNCPMCDAQLHLPLSEASKRISCPECRRVIKVPEPEKRDPANWRQTAPNLPSGAKRAEEKAPEGAWGSATGAATVSRDALHEAGALPQVKEVVSLSRRIVRYAVWSAAVILLLVGAVLGYLKWADSRQQQAVQTAIDYADSESGKAELGADGRAAVYRLAGDFWLRTRRPGCADAARKMFGRSLAATQEGGGGTEHDALLQDLVAALVELGGTTKDVDAGMKLPWDDVQKELRSGLDGIRAPEARLESLHTVARRLAEAGEGARATALAHSLYPSANEEKAEALGAVGLEQWTAGQKDLAAKAADQAIPMYASEKDRPRLAPSVVALAAVLGRPPPAPSKQRAGETADDGANEQIGQAEGLARMKQWDPARGTLLKLQQTWPEYLLRADVALAAADLDDKSSANADVTTAIQQAQAQPGASSPWLLLRLTRIGAKAGIAPDTLRQVAAMIPDPALRGRAQLAALQAQYAQAKQAADLKSVESVDAQTISARLAREEWALRYGSVGVVRAWDAPNRPFGLLGVALGKQGRE